VIQDADVLETESSVVGTSAHLLAVARAVRYVSRAGLITLVVANLVVALQTLRHEWGYYETLLIYWTEAVILGAYNVLRLILVGVAFFIVKFGAFALGIGVFVLLLPAMLRSGGEGGTSIPRALSAAGPGLLIATGALCLSHGVSLVRNFLMGREYDRLNIVGLVFLPYARMSLVGVVLLLGIGVVTAVPGLRRETAFAVVMILLKVAADAVSHTLEHRSLLSEPVPGGD
jgi:hypothetical protein